MARQASITAKEEGLDIEQMRNELTIVIGRIQLAQLRMRKLGIYAEAQGDLELAEAAAWRLRALEEESNDRQSV